MDFRDVYEEYYDRILRFCFAKLNNKQLAEDCTQEVFLALSKKMHILPLDTNVNKWLYNAAILEIKRCLRKNKYEISLDEIPDVPISDAGSGIFDEIINDDEYKTLTEYYVNGKNVEELAKNNNISVSAMYQRISRIKKKIVDNLDKLHKILK